MGEFGEEGFGVGLGFGGEGGRFTLESKEPMMAARRRSRVEGSCQFMGMVTLGWVE